MHRVVILDPGYRSFAVEQQILAEAGADVQCFEGGRHDRAGRIALAADAEGLMLRWTVVDDALLDALPSARYIVRYGVGYDNVDLAAASAHGVRVCNVQGYANHSVSDHALALIYGCVRGLAHGAATMRANYNAPPWEGLPDPHRMTLGILGLGRIGGTLCAKARGLFQEVIACDPYIAPARFAELGARPCGLDELLAQSDVLSVHCNLTEETRHIIDAAALARMKPTALLVNTARGPVVDELALMDAIVSGSLYGAGIDVYGDEPPKANLDPLLNHPRVIATGHYAWSSITAGDELQRRAAENMAAMLRGEVPGDCLNP